MRHIWYKFPSSIHRMEDFKSIHIIKKTEYEETLFFLVGILDYDKNVRLSSYPTEEAAHAELTAIIEYLKKW